MVFHRFLQPSESMGSSKVNIDFPDFPEKYESWWLMVVDRPLWKIWVRQLGWLFPIYGEIKNVPNHQPVLISFCPWIPRNCLGSSKAAFTMDLAAASAASLEETSALTSLGRTKSLMEIWGIGPSTSYRVFHGFLGISEGGIPGVPFRVLLIFQLQPQLNPIDSAGQNTSPPDQALRSADLWRLRATTDEYEKRIEDFYDNHDESGELHLPRLAAAEHIENSIASQDDCISTFTLKFLEFAVVISQAASNPWGGTWHHMARRKNAAKDHRPLARLRPSQDLTSSLVRCLDSFQQSNPHSWQRCFMMFL